MSEQVHWEQVQAWCGAESPHSPCLFFLHLQNTHSIKYHLLFFFCMIVILFEARHNSLNLFELPPHFPQHHHHHHQQLKATESIADEKQLGRCQKNTKRHLFFKKSVIKIEKYQYQKHSASHFSLSIYNHPSHPYIQYIKIYIYKKRTPFGWKIHNIAE